MIILQFLYFLRKNEIIRKKKNIKIKKIEFSQIRKKLNINTVIK